MFDARPRRVAHPVVLVGASGMWRPLMAMPDGSEIQIFWPTPDEPDEFTRATAYRICQQDDVVAQRRTLAEVIDVVRRGCSPGSAGALPDALAGGALPRWDSLVRATEWRSL